jgi:hypothetical protein
LPPLTEARCSHKAVSTGSSILTFGGLRHCGAGNTNGPGLERLTFEGGAAWVRIDAAGEPTHRYEFGAAWTGQAMFLFGGGTDLVPALPEAALYFPARNTWEVFACPASECGRSSGMLTFMDGDNVRIWGGEYPLGPHRGSTYQVAEGVWSAWDAPGAPQNTSKTFADAGQRVFALAGDSVAIYDKISQRWLASDTAPVPSSVCEGSAAWSGHEMFVYSGECSGVPRIGGRYQPAALPPAPPAVHASSATANGALALLLALAGALAMSRYIARAHVSA